MYDYIVAHGNGFATMNYVFVAFWIFFLCTLPASIYVTLVRHPETNKVRYSKDPPKRTVEANDRPSAIDRLSKRISERLSQVDSNNFST